MKGNKINPYHLMENMEYRECSDAVERMIPIIGDLLPEIRRLIEDIPVISEVQKRFYYKIMECRYDKEFLPIYQKIIAEKNTYETGGQQNVQ